MPVSIGHLCSSQLPDGQIPNSRTGKHTFGRQRRIAFQAIGIRCELLGIPEEKRIPFGDLRNKDLASRVTPVDVESCPSDRLKTVGPARHNLDLRVVRP
jgi:hypothetical protein